MQVSFKYEFKIMSPTVARSFPGTLAFFKPHFRPFSLEDKVKTLRICKLAGSVLLWD